jgi:hypothetical protein
MGIDSRTRKQKVSRKILLERPKKKGLKWNLFSYKSYK